MTTAPQHSSKITWSYICSVLAVFIVPPVLGLIAWLLANSAGKEGDPRAASAKTVAIVATVIGLVLGLFILLGQ